MKLIIRLLINAAALWVAAFLVRDVELTSVWWQVLIVAAVFGLVNAFIRPIVRIFSLPLLIVTLGLFAIIINTLLLYLVSWLMGDWLVIHSFLGALLASIIISLVSWLLGMFFSDDK
jgi:putative membrane protein